MNVKPNIPIVAQVPNPALDNSVQHWGFFTKVEIAEATRDGQLLMLDLDFGNECRLRCPGCFRRHYRAGGGKQTGHLRPEDYRRIMTVVDEACTLGLQSVKICGAGEPFEEPLLLRFARELTSRGVGLAIFTKGHVIGDDTAVADVFGHEGITTGETLCHELFELKVSVMPSVPSFDGALVARLVNRSERWYTPRLKRALELLAEVGFNSTRPTRLAFVHAPFTRESVGDALEVYRFARERNILPVLAAHMVSGKQLTPDFLTRFGADDDAKRRLYADVLQYNLEHGYQTREQLLRDGASCMPGIHPCNQIAVGLYVMADGTVMRCPGDFAQPLGNVQEEPLSEIWERCRQWRWTGATNVGCPYKDGITIPGDTYVTLEALAQKG